MEKHPSRIRILIVDDHPVVRTGLTSMLTTQESFDVVGAASTGEEALQLTQQFNPDVLLLDLRMPGMNGFDILRELQRIVSPPRVLVLTSFETDEDVYRAVQAGAHGYLLKSTMQNEMIVAIRAVAEGKRHIPPRIASRLAQRMSRPALTARELEILQMLAKGLTNKQIGTVFQISGNTARNHVNSIIEKLEVADRTEAVSIAIQQGLIDVSD
ncbi:two-component response regulator [Acidisarcina polymorpha]|uniref:Two-component response regulator n=1 Tax=Acidisarcina polymorpha TaxID=2211140 RepID=A0A2Z5G1J8_9BACT|nr:response regulator transcription factor [Acidisarcina polymorpha]AXC12971.1 two-component response regulator [Acidisarcina polymorpha]